MKAFPALRAATFVGLISLSFATSASAQLFHIVGKDSFPGVDTTENTGVAINARFQFNYGGTAGLLRLTLTNLSGTPRPLAEGGGNYTAGILTGFGFDAPSGMSYVNNSFTQVLGAGSGSEPFGINFAVDVGYDLSGLASFDIGAAGTSPSPKSGLSGGYEAVFTFKFTGNLTNFNESNFFSHNGSDADMGFRFQSVGPSGSKSDKVAYWVNDCDIPPIPEPSTYGAMAAGLLLGVVGWKRYRQSVKRAA